MLDPLINAIKKAKGTKPKELLKSLVPVLDWLPRYDKAFLKPDLTAGLTAGAVVIPAAMGYANLAGVPTEYGLYAAFVSLIAYFIFGTSKHLMVVPSSGPAALVGAGLMGLVFADANEYIAAVAMLAFISGLLLIIARMIKLSFIVNFISESVLIGFQIGLALYVIALQLEKILGIDGASGEFTDLIVYYIQHISEASLPTIALAVIGFAFLFVGRRFFKKLPLKFLLIILATIAAMLLPLIDRGIETVGPIPQGLPSLVLPSMGGQSLETMLTIAIGLLLVIYIEGISIAKTFAKKGDYEVDADQEMLAYGAANLSTSFLQGMPVDASASNTSINFDSKAQTQLSGAVAALVIVLVLLFFATFFSNLPVVIIGVIIVASMTPLLDFKVLRSVYAFDKLEFVFAVAALLGVLIWGLLEGIFLGVVLTLFVLLYRFSKPGVRELGRVPGTTEFTGLDNSPGNEIIPGVLVVRVDGAILFPSAARVRFEIKRLIGQARQVRLVVLSMRSSPYIDLQATNMLANLYEELGDKGIALRLAETAKTCRDAIAKAGLESQFGGLRMGMPVQRVIDDWFEEGLRGASEPEPQT